MTHDREKMLGYLRVSTEEQAEHGHGLHAQEDELVRAADYRGWDLELVRDEGLSGKSLQRPGLQRALVRIAAGDAHGLVVAKLDRLTRSVFDFAELLEWFDASGAPFIALDLNVDTSTPSGRMVAQLMVVIAEWERGTIAARTRAGLAAKRARGGTAGRPSVSDRPEVVARIRELQDEGLSLRAIAASLTAEGVPTARGAAVWRASSVQAAAGWTRPAARRTSSDLPDPRPRSR